MTALSTVALPAPAPLAGGIVLPGDPDGFHRSPGGVLLPPGIGGVQTPSPRSIYVPPSGTPIDAPHMQQQARAGWELIARRDGAPTADVLVGSQFPIIDRVAAQERHEKALRDFWAGRREVGSKPAA